MPIIDQDQNLITCQGPKGTLNYKFSEQIEVRSTVCTLCNKLNAKGSTTNIDARAISTGRAY